MPKLPSNIEATSSRFPKKVVGALYPQKEHLCAFEDICFSQSGQFIKLIFYFYLYISFG
ncbi:MAG: hypothetical protein ACI92O_002956 [Colwellia sp.]|jgi:hypothetical protein|tara:strand:+ start:644 stop:820 length:177 start_codon:yes stop_codon:yes gene_type:complete